MVSETGWIKLEHLRKQMKNVSVNNLEGIQAYLITEDDAHQSEYIQDSDKRREFISGFKGSAGTAIVTQDHALLWTDGRYFSQANIELDPIEAWTLMREGVLGTLTIEDWLVQNLPPNSLVGADPNLISNVVWTRVQNRLHKAGHQLVPIERNLIDEVWGDKKPPKISRPIVPHSFLNSGKKAAEKIENCFEEMVKNDVNALVITALDEVAYLLNLRGSDIPYNPVFFAYVILYSKKCHIFFAQEKLTSEARTQLDEEKVNYVLHPYDEVRLFLNKIAKAEKCKIWISDNSSYALHSECVSASTHVAITPVCLMKLVKNENEIEGMKKAHIQDAVALVKYFSWLEEHVTKSTYDNQITELSGAEQIEHFRREFNDYVGPSFQTISAVGKHGAIIHYQPSVSSDIPINSHELYLCDTGSHFLGGTTDVTRTLHFGNPSDYERECFTRVFKGQCCLSRSKFPKAIKGNYLDAFARRSLWDVGLDYLHGTGHGVGAYLNVHEYPTMISWRPYPDDPGLLAGMFLSNEPGYYEDGAFGIRLENVEMVVEATTKYTLSGREFLTFDTVTLVPIQTRLLVTSMLTDDEITYLNAYHKKCLDTLQPYLSNPESAFALNWLKRETMPISRTS